MEELLELGYKEIDRYEHFNNYAGFGVSLLM